MKKLLSISLILALVLSMAACGEGGSAATSGSAAPSAPASAQGSEATTENSNGTKPLIGHLSISLGSDFTTQADNGIRRAGEEKGYEVMTIDTNLDPELELTGVETMITSGVKAFYTISVSSENVWNAVQAKDPSVAVLSQQPDATATAHVVLDNVEMANMFLSSLDSFMDERGMDSAKVGFLWLAECESPEMPMYTSRQDVLEVVNAAFDGTDNEILCEFFTSDGEAQISNAESVLNMYPECNVIFCYSSGAAIAASNVVGSAGKDPQKFYIFSSESEDEVFRKISDTGSALQGCASGSVEELGYNIGLQLIRYVETGEIEDVPTPKELCDWRNIDEFI